MANETAGNRLAISSTFGAPEPSNNHFKQHPFRLPQQDRTGDLINAKQPAAEGKTKLPRRPPALLRIHFRTFESPLADADFSAGSGINFKRIKPSTSGTTAGTEMGHAVCPSACPLNLAPLEKPAGCQTTCLHTQNQLMGRC